LKTGIFPQKKTGKSRFGKYMKLWTRD